MFQKFYQTDDSAVKGNNGSDEDMIIKYTFDGKVEREADLRTPEGRLIAKQLGEKGILYNKEMHQISDVKKQAQLYQYWDSAIKKAADTGNPDTIIALLNDVGVKLTPAQKADIKAGDLDLEDNPELMKQLSKLTEEVNKLKTEVKESEKRILWMNEDKTAHSKLSEKYNGRDGLPKYEPDKISQWCKDTGFFMNNPEEQFERAYRIMNEEDIKKAVDNKNQALRKSQDRVSDFVPSGEKQVKMPAPNIDLSKSSYSELASFMANHAKESGIPIVLDD